MSKSAPSAPPGSAAEPTARVLTVGQVAILEATAREMIAWTSDDSDEYPTDHRVRTLAHGIRNIACGPQTEAHPPKSSILIDARPAFELTIPEEAWEETGPDDHAKWTRLYTRLHINGALLALEALAVEFGDDPDDKDSYGIHAVRVPCETGDPDPKNVYRPFEDELDARYLIAGEGASFDGLMIRGRHYILVAT
jgi:hypothetical protein